MRVALLKLDTDGSRPIGEISESCKHKHITAVGLQLVLILAENGFQQGWLREQKGFFITIPLVSRQIFTQTTTSPSGGRNTAAFVQTQLVIINVLHF